LQDCAGMAERKPARDTYAAIIRSISATISRRWKGLDSTRASRGASSRAFRATAAKPVMNMTLI